MLSSSAPSPSYQQCNSLEGSLSPPLNHHHHPGAIRSDRKAGSEAAVIENLGGTELRFDRHNSRQYFVSPDLHFGSTNLRTHDTAAFARILPQSLLTARKSTTSIQKHHPCRFTDYTTLLRLLCALTPRSTQPRRKQRRTLDHLESILQSTATTPIRSGAVIAASLPGADQE